MPLIKPPRLLPGQKVAAGDLQTRELIMPLIKPPRLLPGQKVAAGDL